MNIDQPDEQRTETSSGLPRAADASNREDRLAAEVRALSRLNEVSMRLWRISDVDEGLEEILSATVSLLAGDKGRVQLLDAAGELRIAAEQGFDRSFLDHSAKAGSANESPCGRALRGGDRIIVEDIAADPRCETLRSVAKAAGYRAVQATPIVGRRGNVLGVVSTHFHRARRPSEQDLRLLDLYVRQAADFIERCASDKGLRSSEQRLKAVADIAPGTMLWVTEPDGACSFMSQGWYEYTGQAVDQALGLGWLRMIHPSDREHIRCNFAAANEQRKAFYLDYRLRQANGEYRWAMAAGRARYDEAGNYLGFIGSVIDVHERKLAEAALRESEARFREMADGLPLIVWVHGPTGAQELVNNTFCEFFGVTREQMKGGQWQILMHPDDAEGYAAEFYACARDRRPFHAEVRVKRADGEWRRIESWGRPRFDSNGEFRGFVGTSVDVTDRNEAEAALRQSEERLELALAAGRSGAWDWDLERGEATVSQSYRELYGFPPDLQVTYDVWLAAVHPEDRERVRRYGDAFFRSGIEWRLDYRIVHPERGERWMEAVGRLHRDAAGRARRFVGVQSDVTERMRAERALRETDRRKDEFLAVLGHELRNPLAPLSMAVDVLQRGHGEPHVAESVQPMMRRQLDHLTRLVDDLLDVSRIKRGHAELRRAPLDLRRAVEAAVEQSRPLIEDRQHTLKLELGPAPLRVYGDFQRLTQIFGNLLSNAARYGDPGGKVTVRAGREGDVALVKVTDTGFGIPQEQLDLLFEMFAQVPEHRSLVGGGGLGIGLALARQLIELHGGSIEARSEGLGCGSEFVAVLPLAEVDGDAAQRDEAASARRGRRRVLVVDDNVDAANMLSRMLELQGHEVRAVHDGPAALETFPGFSPQVVLLDLGLPRMDGFEVARRLRSMERGSELLLVAITGWGQEEDRRRSAEAGFDEHLTKPVRPDVLSSLLADALGH